MTMITVERLKSGDERTEPMRSGEEMWVCRRRTPSGLERNCFSLTVHKTTTQNTALIELDDVTCDVIAPSERLMWLCFSLLLAAGLCFLFSTCPFLIITLLAMQYL